jgi:threonine dehydrogenase-like Zn-dependent dehydrogenase
VSGERAKAAVLVSPGRIEIEEFLLPSCGDDDGVLRVEATGVCGSDVAVYRGEFSEDLFPLPLVLGHEIVGRIERIGPRAAERWGVREGDRIVVEEHLPCGRCDLCRDGRHKLCIKRRYGSVSTRTAPALWGGYAEAVYLHPDSVVYPVANSLAAELAPLFIPISNGLDWVERVGGLRVGGTVVIEGPGAHGLGCVVGARECGAGTIILTGLARDRARLELGKTLGATHVIEADREDVRERVREITNDRLADLVIDVTPGAAEPLEIAVDVAGIGGTILVAGYKHGKPIAGFRSDPLFFKELTVKGVWGRSSAAVPPALRLIESGRYPLELLCTHSFPVEGTADALETAAGTRAADVIHVTVLPDR